MTDWFAVGFKGAITHVVPRELFDALVDDMLAKGHPIENFEEKYGYEQAKALGGNPTKVTDWAFDLGGGYVAGMPKETLEIDGLPIEVTCDHLGTVESMITRNNVPRRFADGRPYYKLKFCCACDQCERFRAEHAL